MCDTIYEPAAEVKTELGLTRSCKEDSEVFEDCFLGTDQTMLMIMTVIYIFLIFAPYIYNCYQANVTKHAFNFKSSNRKCICICITRKRRKYR